MSTPTGAFSEQTFADITYEGPFKSHCGPVEYLLEDTTSYWSLDATQRQVTVAPLTPDVGQKQVGLIVRLQDHQSTQDTFSFTSEVLACSLNSFLADPDKLLPASPVLYASRTRSETLTMPFDFIFDASPGCIYEQTYSVVIDGVDVTDSLPAWLTVDKVTSPP